MTNPSYLMVSAPLSITDMDKNLASDVIYIFDYNKSDFKNEQFMDYVQQLGCICDIIFSKDTPFEEKSLILKSYLLNPTKLHYYHLIMTWLNIVFTYKKIDIQFEDSLFTKADIVKFIKSNETLIKSAIKFYDSLFILMLCRLGNEDITSIKYKYDKDKRISDVIPPNFLVPLLFSEFYDYYKNSIENNNAYYYENVFTNSFEKDLFNENNFIWKILLQLSDKQFQDFLERQGFHDS
jgi:hypothetical protein